MTLAEFKEKIGDDLEAFERNLEADGYNKGVDKYLKNNSHCQFWKLIDRAFDWAETPEGVNYWYKVAYEKDAV